MKADIDRIDDFWSAPAGQADSGAGLYSGEAAQMEASQRRLLAAVFVLLAGVTLGVFSLLVGLRGQSGLNWILVAAALLSGFMLLYRNFSLGIVLFIGICWVGIGTPAVATGGSGVGKGLPLSQVGLGALLFVWGTRMFLKREFSLYHCPINRPVLFYLAVCIWSTLNSFLFRDPHVLVQSVRQYGIVNAIEIVIRLLSLGAMILLAANLRGRMLGIAAFAVILPGVATFTGLLSFIPASQFLAFPQIIAMAILIALALSGCGAPWLRVAGATLAAAILLSFVIHNIAWVTGWLAALVCAGVILFLQNRRLFWIGCAMLAVAALIQVGYIREHVVEESVKSGDMHRFDMMRSALLYATHFPLGIGLGNYRAYNFYYGRADVWNTTSYTSAHGTYSQALAESGFLGLIALLALVITIARVLHRCWLRLPPGFARSYTLGVLGSFLGIASASLIGDYLFPAYHNNGLHSFGSTVYIFLAVGVALAMARENGLAWSEDRPEQRGAAPAAAPAPLILRPLDAVPASGRPALEIPVAQPREGS